MPDAHVAEAGEERDHDSERTVDARDDAAEQWTVDCGNVDWGATKGGPRRAVPRACRECPYVQLYGT